MELSRTKAPRKQQAPPHVSDHGQSPAIARLPCATLLLDLKVRLPSNSADIRELSALKRRSSESLYQLIMELFSFIARRPGRSMAALATALLLAIVALQPSRAGVVASAPVITSQPSNAVAGVGEDIAFGVV